MRKNSVSYLWRARRQVLRPDSLDLPGGGQEDSHTITVKNATLCALAPEILLSRRQRCKPGTYAANDGDDAEANSMPGLEAGRVATTADSRSFVGGIVLLIIACLLGESVQSSFASTKAPAESRSSRVGFASLPASGNEGPIPRTMTFLG